MTFIIAIFQLHCKNEHRQVKWNKIKRDMCKSDSICPYLQGTALFEWFLKYIYIHIFLDNVYLKN